MLTFCSCYVLLFVTIIVALDNSLVTAGFTFFQSTKSSKTTLSLSLNDWSRSTTKTMCRESFLSSCSKKGTAFLSIIGIVAAIEPTDQCSAVEWNFIKNTRNRSNNGNSNNNPRYIEKELQMEYGTDGGTLLFFFNIGRFPSFIYPRWSITLFVCNMLYVTQ